jgi:hypothetical protein
MRNDSTDHPLLIQLNADGRQGWRSIPLPAATSPIQRLRNGIESLVDELDFAQWLLAICITATVLLTKRRLRDMAMRSIGFFFGC